MSQSAGDKLSRAAKDRRAQLAAAALATAGAAAAAKAVHAARGEQRDTAGRAFRLRREENPSASMRRIALGRAEQALERMHEAQTAEHPAPCVHGARKDLKKLRAVVRLLRRELGDELYRAESQRYRDAGRTLSASRDTEAKLEALEALGERLPRTASADWREALREERDRAVASARADDAQSVGAAIELVVEGRERIAEWPLRSDSWKLVGPGLERTYRRGRRAMRRAAEEPSPENLHRWRKRAKDLWYQLRILRDAQPEELADSTELADRLSEALGDHHDLKLLRDDLLVRDLPAAPRHALVTAIVARQEELAAEAFALGRRLYDLKPKAFRGAMRRGWKRWRKR